MQNIFAKTLPSFLSFSKSLFLSLSSFPAFPPKKFFFVLGNEASDIDSIVGSLTLAFHRQNLTQIPYSFDSPGNSIKEIMASNDKYYIPVINCPKSELISRFDWNYLAEYLEIKSEDLCFFEDFKHLTNKENTHLILFDHNFPTKAQHFLAPLVTEIIDHHENLNLFSPSQPIFKIIRKSGSCCSILSELIDHSSEKLDSLPANILYALFLTILMDTMNFDPKLRENRWVDQDLEIFNRLKGLLEYQPAFQLKIKDINKLYKEILDLKYSEKQNLALPLDLIFGKDRKTFHYGFGKVDFATIFVNPMSFINAYGNSKIREFVFRKLKEEEFLAYIFLFVYPDKDDSLFRDFLAFSMNQEFINKIRENFSEKKMKMKEKEIEICWDEQLKKEMVLFASDEEKVYSRKLLEPIISKLEL